MSDNTSSSYHNFLMFLRFNGDFFLLTLNKSKPLSQKGCEGVNAFSDCDNFFGLLTVIKKTYFTNLLVQDLRLKVIHLK